MEMDMNEYQSKAKKTAVYPNICGLYNAAVKRTGGTTSLSVTPDQFRQYVKEVRNPYYPALGLAGEVGEFCNKLKKVMRDKDGQVTPEFLQFAKGELGDILWYLSACATELDLSLGEIASDNLAKLAKRQNENKLQGEGDNR